MISFFISFFFASCEIILGKKVFHKVLRNVHMKAQGCSNYIKLNKHQIRNSMLVFL